MATEQPKCEVCGSDKYSEGGTCPMLATYKHRTAEMIASDKATEQPREGWEYKLRKEIHMKGLGYSKNAKDCGDLTVVPLGYVQEIAMYFIAQERSIASREAVEERVSMIREELAKLTEYRTMYGSIWSYKVSDIESLPSLQLPASDSDTN